MLQLPWVAGRGELRSTCQNGAWGSGRARGITGMCTAPITHRPRTPRFQLASSFLTHVVDSASTRDLGPLSEYLRPPRCPPPPAQTSSPDMELLPSITEVLKIRTAGPRRYPANGGAAIGHSPTISGKRAVVGPGPGEEGGMEVGEGSDTLGRRSTLYPHVS